MKKLRTFNNSVRMLITFMLSLLLAVNMPFAASAAVDDSFAQDELIYFVTEEGSGSESGKVIAAFNENIDPETVTRIIVPGTVTNGGRSYIVSELVNNAFAGCKALKWLDLGNCTGLTAIGMSAFLDCVNMTHITIPCNFNKNLFSDTGVVPNGDKYTIEYAAYDGNEGSQPPIMQVKGNFIYRHDWKLDSNNPKQHICTRCQLTGEHNYSVTAKGYACDECGDEKSKAELCDHEWEVLPKTIANDTAKYECARCDTVQVQEIGVGESMTAFNGQKLKTILQDPYKVLPEGVELKVKSIEPGSARYNELLANLDDTHKVENVAFFEIELYNAKNEKISGEIAGKVRVLIQIPDGWDKKDLEAVLVMAGADVEFEESVITIDGKDYLAFWTDHFSPYALIDVATKQDKKSNSAETTERNSEKTSPATGNSDFVLISALAAVSVSAVVFIYLIIERKRKKA